ncbi:MAG: hypothetical protein POG24_08155 [Acidocella sp.]|nr:hypothetical protein [Acidocella sp.]
MHALKLRPPRTSPRPPPPAGAQSLAGAALSAIFTGMDGVWVNIEPILHIRRRRIPPGQVWNAAIGLGQ